MAEKFKVFGATNNVAAVLQIMLSSEYKTLTFFGPDKYEPAFVIFHLIVST